MITIRKKPNFKRLMYEKEAWAKNEVVCGIDEVGRSCLAGPLVAAAAILKPFAKHRYLKDSKLLTSQERVVAYKWLIKNCNYAVGIVHHRLIDSVNIYNATVYAMKRAVMQVLTISHKQPSLILVDAVALKLDSIDIPVICFSHGERQSSSIAAASIVAKVTRDNLMRRMHNFIPGYAFYSNKGYGTLTHRTAIDGEGISFCHRLTFTIYSNRNKIKEQTDLL